jgi:hypothetical protein
MLAGEYVSSGNLEFRVAEQKAAYYARAPKLLDRLREALRTRHYSRRTEQTYCQNKWPDGQQVVERSVFSTLRREIGRCLILTTYKIIASYADPSNICWAGREGMRS